MSRVGANPTHRAFDDRSAGDAEKQINTNDVDRPRASKNLTPRLELVGKIAETLGQKRVGMKNVENRSNTQRINDRRAKSDTIRTVINR